ncbi:MAG: nucleotidyl transferase AbiEii/AbiGii toxin family protein [Verrucomicrobia bacterium]|nr:nucleotidyl transferase AbiEii/AbiGii toxin family protein [Verrucomicrobiota bacterium]MBU4290792.1 nucleotidyl transferase AbiEii/AbiGii toxin family protein [Verrucomicrobiota bacterium]MBU4429801.1 nucleotidyl transferase AbiEii/AbiGii toxin family protein [Verrucomicrobiota bacterium]MBU4497464.1 nucleotidyl transferase AbiEii/AbiGii toxin family protein [Verrucomicrobiota bacterium]MCG2681683.1 nucleotidyl transferase AbiEii/AbiGii toxin family protein [Kiritimatiellia bacterium]
MHILQQIEYIERFHLLFLAQLGQKLDKRFYALKGGCNLRFFFKSIRYSEDMDLDVQTIPVGELRGRVVGILKSAPFRQALAVHGMNIEHFTEAKQTETTQRWKFGLLTPVSATPAPTKIEFSRRRPFDDAILENVDPLLVRSLGLPPILACHYPAAMAWRQKIQALATRSVTQVRDLFDLDLLLSSGAVVPASETVSLPADLLQEAEQRCLTMRFKDFKSQVLSYLTPGHQAAYDDPEVWDHMVLRVTEALRGQR